MLVETAQNYIFCKTSSKRKILDSAKHLKSFNIALVLRNANSIKQKIEFPFHCRIHGDILILYNTILAETHGSIKSL